MHVWFGEKMKKLRSTIVLCVLLLVILSIIPTVVSYPFKQDSLIELNYESLDGNLVAPVDIEFSGFIHEYQAMYYSLFFVLLGLNEGYRNLRFCNITLVVGDFNLTQEAIFGNSVEGARGERTFFITISSLFLIQQSMIISDMVNDTLSFQANYKFEISGYEHMFEDEMTGTAIVKIEDVQDEVPDEEVPDPDDEVLDDETPDEDEEISDVPDNNIQIVSILAIVCLIIGVLGFFLAKRKS